MHSVGGAGWGSDREDAAALLIHGNGRPRSSLEATSGVAVGGRTRAAARVVPPSPSQGAGLHDQPRLPGGGTGAPEPAPFERRELHQPSARRRPDRGRHRPRRGVGHRGAAARRRRGHRDHGRRRRPRLRARGRGDRRRRHQARTDPLRLPRGAAGRHDAQDARGDGQGPAGARHQARRPAAQHAHDRRDAAREAAAHRPGDARHLRAAGPSPRHAGD